MGGNEDCLSALSAARENYKPECYSTSQWLEDTITQVQALALDHEFNNENSKQALHMVRTPGLPPKSRLNQFKGLRRPHFHLSVSCRKENISFRELHLEVTEAPLLTVL